MILDDYKHKAGKSCRTVALRNLMDRNGLDFTEDFIFGFANGLTFSFAKPDKDSESLYFKCIAPNLFQFENFAMNMGLEYQTITKVGTDYSLIERILKNDDNPVLCEVVPMAYKKYLKSDGVFWTQLKMDVPLTSHIMEVIGVDNNNVYFCENYSEKVFQIPKRTFEKARNGKKDTYLNPHHKIHYFMIPENISQINLEQIICKAIKNNVVNYFSSDNKKLGMIAFNDFIESFPTMYDAYGARVCKKSLCMTGNLIKYVTPGMFRKLYSRFIKECIFIIGYEEKLDKISRLFSQSDYLWNKFAAHILSNRTSVSECMRGEKSLEFIKKINDTEQEATRMLLEVSEAW